MRRPLFLLAVLLGLGCSTAWGQSARGATYYLRYPAGQPAYTRQLLPAVPAPPAAAAPGPTVRAAALLATTRQPTRLLVADSLLPAPRRDGTGVQPLYDLYRNLPEDFRKHTLPAVYTEPLPVQLLRGLLVR